MKVHSLNDVFQDQLMDLYSAEKQLTKALPKMEKAATSQDLKRAFQEHLEETEEHVKRLEQVAEKVGISVGGETCEAMEGLVEEAENLIDENDASEALDAAIIASAQRVEHYEIAAYGTVRTIARHLGFDEARDILQTTLNEEGAADEKLTKLAEREVNREAVRG